MRTGQVYGRVKLKDGRVATLRAMKPGDVVALRAFAAALVEERAFYPDLGILLDRLPSLKEEREFVDHVTKGISRGDTVSVLAVVGGVVAGNSEVSRSRSGDTRHVGRLGIAVDERFRGVGLGRAMMETLIERCTAAGIRLLVLDVFANNARAIALYESLGFRRYGRLPGGVYRAGKAIDVIQMLRQD